MESDDLFDPFTLLDELHKIVDSNTDDSPMEIGDRVIPWDGSSISTINGKKVYIIDEPFISTKYFIVIGNREKSKLQGISSEYLQDLLIVNPKNGDKYRINSKMVKHFI